MIQISKPLITGKDIQEITKVLKSGNLVQGKKVAEFEEKFASYYGSKYAIAVNSGTAALHAALHALGIGAGDEVLVPAFTFIATANIVLLANAKPKFVDIDEKTFCLDPSLLEKSINKNTKAIIAVSLYGNPYDKKIDQIAKKYNIPVIEDAAQALGSKSKNSPTLTAFSFYATKNIHTIEGGMVATNIKKYAKTCQRFRNHGREETAGYEHIDVGHNYRMTEIEAVIGLNQLSDAEKFVKTRIGNAKKLISGLKSITQIKLPDIPKKGQHSFNQFTVRVKKNRDKLHSQLTQNGIQAGIYYPKSLHLYPHFKKLGYKKGDFPIAEQAAKEVISIPVHPGLKEYEIKKIIKSLKLSCQN